MPLYDFVCDSCGCRHDNVMRFISQRDEYEACKVCNAPMRREFPLVHTDLKDFAEPILMHSIGCLDAGQVEEMARAGVEISTDPANPDYGIPVARNRHEKLKALRIAGFQEAN